MPFLLRVTRARCKLYPSPRRVPSSSSRLEIFPTRARARSFSYADIQKNHEVTYVAGGAAQNAARAAQVSFALFSAWKALS